MFIERARKSSSEALSSFVSLRANVCQATSNELRALRCSSEKLGFHFSCDSIEYPTQGYLGFVSDFQSRDNRGANVAASSMVKQAKLNAFIATKVSCFYDDGKDKVGGRREELFKKDKFPFSPVLTTNAWGLLVYLFNRSVVSMGIGNEPTVSHKTWKDRSCSFFDRS